MDPMNATKMEFMDFWDAFWLLLIFIPLLLIWGFALVDIFRRDDMKGWLKAVWVILVVLVPFLGTLIYLIFRQPGATPEERRAMDEASRDFVARYSPGDSAQQLALLSDLHDRGKLTDAEFAAEKARVMAAEAKTARPASGPGGTREAPGEAPSATPETPSGTATAADTPADTAAGKGA